MVTVAKDATRKSNSASVTQNGASGPPVSLMHDVAPFWPTLWISGKILASPPYGFMEEHTG